MTRFGTSGNALCLLAVSATLISGSRAASPEGVGPSVPLTPAVVWQDFDPEVGPLEEEIIKQWASDGIHYKEVYFNAFVHGHKVRVYGIYAAPEQAGPYPAILHMHGGGQTVSMPWLKVWADRGYATLSINCHGRWPDRDRYTIYPDALIQGNHLDAKEHTQLGKTTPTLKESSWYVWAAVNRRALTYLAAQEGVDSSRIGIFGTSMGGTSVWHVAIDPRVKAACAIYGVGWNDESLYRQKYNEKIQRPVVTAQEQNWLMGMAPQAYGPYIRCPMLFLNGSNDHHGNLDYAFDTLARLPPDVPRRIAVTPHFRHHIGRQQGANLLLWMDTWLKDGDVWPETPVVYMTVGEGRDPVLVVQVDQVSEVEKVRVYYNIGNTDNKSRFWREVKPLGDGTVWTAPMQTTDAQERLFAFANVHYKTGVCLTSNLVAEVPAVIGAIANDLPHLHIYDGSMGMAGWTTESPGTDPIPPVPVPLRVTTGPGGVRGVSPENVYRRLMTYKIGDPSWQGPKGAMLQFKAYSEVEQDIAIKVADGVISSSANEYLASVHLEGGEHWQDIVLPTSRFNSLSGSGTLESWQNLVVLWVVPAAGNALEDERLILSEFNWMPNAAVARQKVTHGD